MVPIFMPDSFSSSYMEKDFINVLPVVILTLNYTKFNFSSVTNGNKAKTTTVKTYFKMNTNLFYILINSLKSLNLCNPIDIKSA